MYMFTENRLINMDKIDMIYIDTREDRRGDTLIVRAILNMCWTDDSLLTLHSFGSKEEAEKVLGKILKAISHGYPIIYLDSLLIEDD